MPPLYNFSFFDDRAHIPEDEPAVIKPVVEPIIGNKPVRLPDNLVRNELRDDELNKNVEIVTQFLNKGFHVQDEAIKAYFSNLMFPDKSTGFRNVSVKIAGGDKTILAWAQERKNGRIKLPVLSINRDNEEYNVEKYSPPHHEMRRRYLDGGSKVELIYRPAPWNLNYSLQLWAERKTEAEYIKAQILQRFNGGSPPIAQWLVEDEYLSGNVDAFLLSSTNSSDIDVAPEELAKVRFDFSIKVEAWLPLPTKIVPTVLGVTESMEISDDPEDYE